CDDVVTIQHRDSSQLIRSVGRPGHHLPKVNPGLRTRDPSIGAWWAREGKRIETGSNSKRPGLERHPAGEGEPPHKDCFHHPEGRDSTWNTQCHLLEEKKTEF
ncbi:Hypothetical predicted protein, partial [Marmota monax]